MKNSVKKFSFLVSLIIVAGMLHAQNVKTETTLDVRNLSEKHETGLVINKSPDSDISFVSFFLPEESFVDIAVYDQKGNKIHSLISERVSSGLHTFGWLSKELNDGTFYIGLNTGSEENQNKYIVQR
jgi:hypothetical protein